MQYRYVDLSIDLDARRVTRDGVDLQLQGLSFDLLAYLLVQGDRVVGADELIAQVWAPALVNEETVTQRVKLLRQALGDDSRRPRYLRTVRGRGYQLCAKPLAAAGGSDATDAAERLLSRPWAKAAAAALVITILMLGALWWPRPEQVAERRSLAKLHPGGSDANAAGLIERARYYAGIGQRDDTLRAIELYRQVLAADGNSVDARLGLSFATSAMMCAHNGGSQWAIEAEQLAEGLIAQDPAHAAAYAARAYAADCRGLIDRAMADYAHAVELDPAARLDSLASLAHLQAVRGELARALAGNLRARNGRHNLRLVDLQLSHTLELLGYAGAAERLLQRSFQLHPDSAFIAAAWPAYLYRQGRLQQAREALAQAQQRPQHPDLWLLAAELALLDGDTAAAADAYAQAAALKPGSGPAESLQRIHSDTLDAEWAQARLQQLAQGIEAGDRWPDNWLEIAQLQLALGDPDSALDALDLARQAGYRDRAELTVSALWRPLRNHPRFIALLEQIATAVAAERDKARQVPGLAELLAEGVS